MAQIDVYNRERGVTYVYESFSYWDKDLKQPRSKRKLIGKRDADGNLIPTGTRGRKKAEPQPSSPDHSDTDYQRCILLMQEKDEIILSLKQQLAAVQSENESLRHAIQSDIPSVTLDVTLNGTEMAVLALLKQKPSSSRTEIADRISKTVRTVQRALDSLREKGYIRRVGSKQEPKWEILK